LIKLISITLIKNQVAYLIKVNKAADSPSGIKKIKGIGVVQFISLRLLFTSFYFLLLTFYLVTGIDERIEASVAAGEIVVSPQ